MLEFNVNNQIIERKDSFRVVADSKNYLTASFVFSDEWQDNIIAVFGDCNEKFYDVVLENGKCTVPWEIIKEPFFTVSVFCGDLVTANALKVEVEKSGYRKGQQPGEPTPDIYSQFLNMAKPPYIGDDGNWFVWNKETGTFEDSGITTKGADGCTPVRGTDYWTEDDIVEIKTYVDEAILGGAW